MKVDVLEPAAQDPKEEAPVVSITGQSRLLLVVSVE